jgi:uncharacterized protein YcfJ
MRSIGKTILAAGAMLLALRAVAQVTLYEAEGYQGAAFVVDRTIPDFAPAGYNDRVASVVVRRGTWEACEYAGFRGRCTTLPPGNYPSLSALGFGNRISSVRPVDWDAKSAIAAPPPPAYDYRRRPGEHLFEVPVHTVHAVVGPPEQRCWVERQQVVEPAQSAPNVPGAIVGAIIGGVLGHQVGGGRGQDVATAGGAVAGAAVGANVGRSPGAVYSQDVQRCAAVPGSARPEFWDVTYYFDGREHHMQMRSPPPPTIWVNRAGDPRT